MTHDLILAYLAEIYLVQLPGFDLLVTNWLWIIYTVQGGTSDIFLIIIRCCYWIILNIYAQISLIA